MITLKTEDRIWVDNVWEKLDKKLSKSAVSAREKIPYMSVDGVYNDIGKEAPHGWTNGFWPGLMWLMYVGTKNEEYRKTAEVAEKTMDAALYKPSLLHHDVGFMWQISSGVNYRLFGTEESKERTLLAANVLAGRYNSRGRYIRAWQEEDAKGKVIIDCMMNIPLLYWASRETKDERYSYIAESQADHTIETHIRADGSVRHIVDLDPSTGEIKEVLGGQGYSPESAWARGQGWAIYGYALSYIHTKKQLYLDTAKKVANFFIANVSDSGYIPRVDLKAPGNEHDTTAGAIAACGLIEIAKCVDENERDMYLNAAIKILRATEEKYCTWEENVESVLSGGVERYHPDEGRIGHNIIYGDYYFAESIYKLKGFEMLFW